MKVIFIYNSPHSSDIYIFDGGGAKNIILLNSISFSLPLDNVFI